MMKGCRELCKGCLADKSCRHQDDHHKLDNCLKTVCQAGPCKVKDGEEENKNAVRCS